MRPRDFLWHCAGMCWWERMKREEYSLRRFFCFICIYTSSNFLSIFIFFAFIIFILFPVIYTLFLFLLFAFYYLYFPLFYIYLGTLNQLMALRPEKGASAVNNRMTEAIKDKYGVKRWVFIYYFWFIAYDSFIIY